MAGKRKSASLKKDPANRRSKKRISSAAAESVRDFVGDAKAEVKVEGLTVVADGSAEKLESPVRVDNPKAEEDDDEGETRFLGEPVPDEEARKRWPHRYQKDNKVM